MLTDVDSIMRPLVLVEVATLAESLTTGVALERSLVCVRAFVAGQLRRLLELFATPLEIAFVRPVAGVCVVVVVQSLLRGEGHTAVVIGAGVRFVCLRLAPY